MAVDPATRARAEAIVAELDLSELDAFLDITDELAAILADAGYKALAQVGVPDESDLVNQVNARAVRYAEDRAAEMVGKIRLADGELIDNPNALWSISESTRDWLREVIASGLADNVGTDEIQAMIEDSGMFSEDRAEMIAHTEVAMANSAGALESYRDAAETGIPLRKVWLTAGDDRVDEDVCQPNEDEGPIELDELFPSGDDAPPGHPNCRCVLTVEVGDTEA